MLLIFLFVANVVILPAESTLLDATTEKEKIFFETLQKIVDARTRLARQQLDFDQLSLDFQTRLDDKEFKACEISDSFKAFKREILERAENSRTGQVNEFCYLLHFIIYFIIFHNSYDNSLSLLFLRL